MASYSFMVLLHTGLTHWPRPLKNVIDPSDSPLKSEESITRVKGAEEDASIWDEFTASQPGQKQQKRVEIAWIVVNNLPVLLPTQFLRSSTRP